MIHTLQSLVPPALSVTQVLPQAERVVLVATATTRCSSCPLCNRPSLRVHSHYLRRLADLAWHGHVVEIHLRARRFRCDGAACSQRIFTERLPQTVRPKARRTLRLSKVQRSIAFAVGGEPGSRLARRLAVPASGDTLLRMIRGATLELATPPRVIGIDDWAWRRGHRYGTILCDLERNRVIDLLPDRSADAVAAWLKRHSGVEVVARDRAGVYADGARQGAPQALQVADRWHLLENCSHAMLDMLKRHQRPLRVAARAALPRSPSEPSPSPRADIPPMSSAEQRAWERWRRQRLAYEEVKRLHRRGVPIKQIARRLRVARNTIRRWVGGGEPELHRPRISSLVPYWSTLARRWAEGCRNGAQLWRELRSIGFTGSLRVVTEWATRQRLASRPGRLASGASVPSCRRTARMLAAEPRTLSEPKRAYLARLLAAAPQIAKAHDLAKGFAAMVRLQTVDELDRWLADAEQSELRSFATGLRQDEAAVRAALTEPWSTSPVEGHINRLKTLKRAMYGRANHDLLRQRILAAA